MAFFPLTFLKQEGVVDVTGRNPATFNQKQNKKQ